jgi:hypothetical protein
MYNKKNIGLCYMSLSLITSGPNSYDLYSKSLTSDLLEIRDAIIDHFSATNVDVTGTATVGTSVVTGSASAADLTVSTFITADDVESSSMVANTGTFIDMISDRIKTTTNHWYQATWAADKAYLVNDFVYSGNPPLLYRCLLANTNVQPSQTVTQPQWAQLSSLNAIINDNQYCQCNTNSSDSKALVSPVPFKTVGAALTYLGSTPGYIRMVGQNQIYDETPITVTTTGITIDGGNDLFQSGGNTITREVRVTNTGNFVLKNVTLQSTVESNLLKLDGVRGSCFYQFNAIPNGSGANVEVYFRSSTRTWGGLHVFYNCKSNDLTSHVDFDLGGTCDPGTRVYIINALTEGGIDVQMNMTNPTDCQVYILNCENLICNNANFHPGGQMVVINTKTLTNMVSSATNANPATKLILSGVDMYNYGTSAYNVLTQTGNGPLWITNCNMPIAGNTITGTVTYGNARFTDAKLTTATCSTSLTTASLVMSGGVTTTPAMKIYDAGNTYFSTATIRWQKIGNVVYCATNDWAGFRCNPAPTAAQIIYLAINSDGSSPFGTSPKLPLPAGSPITYTTSCYVPTQSSLVVYADGGYTHITLGSETPWDTAASDNVVESFTFFYFV